MGVNIDFVSLDKWMKDHYPSPGDRIKQYVVDERNLRAWELATCPRVVVPDHVDNCECQCRNVGEHAWVDLTHDSCGECEDIQDRTSTRQDVVDWLAERDKQPKPCADRELLSDEVAPPLPAFKLPSWFKP